MDTPKKCNFEKTSRGFPELLDENRYRYQKTSKVLKSGASKWLCKENRNPLVKCNAYAVVTGDEFVIKGFHLHGTAKQEAKAIEKGVIRTFNNDLFNNDASFRKVVSSLISLSFVPKQEIVKVFDSTIKVLIHESEGEWQKLGYEDEAKDLLRYFERTYIGSLGSLQMVDMVFRRKRNDPMFEFRLWNKYDCLNTGNYVLTNNSLEAFNSS